MMNPFQPLFEQLEQMAEDIASLRAELKEKQDQAFAEELCTPKEAAKVLRCSVSHVHTLRQQGLIKYVRQELKVYRKSDLLAIGKDKR